MAKHCITVYFAIRESKQNKKGLCPIEIIISVASDRVKFNTGKFAPAKKWNKSTQQIDGNSEEIALTNDFLCQLRNKVYEKEQQLMERGFPITASLVRDAVQDKVDALNEKTLLCFLSEYIESRRSAVGTTLSEASFFVYTYTHRMVKEYIEIHTRRKDILLREVNLIFMQGWHSFLLQRMGQNTASKYLSFLKTLIGYAVANGYLLTNRIQSYKVERLPVDIDYLDEVELANFESFKTDQPHLEVAKDMFLFGCYTGLAYSDIVSLGVEHLYFDEQHRLWIKKKRVKTGVLSRIPVLPKAKAIIIKYAVKNLGYKDYHITPVQDLADLNKNIKKIAVACNISKKKLTFHVSRHTFATTVTLSNHISLEVVSKMMGHTNTRMTSHYARVVDKCIAEEMEALLNLEKGSK